jgi:hypothetical protein
MPESPKWPDLFDRRQPIPMMATPMDNQISSPFDATIVEADDYIELTFHIGDLRPGETFRNPSSHARRVLGSVGAHTG